MNDECGPRSRQPDNGLLLCFAIQSDWSGSNDPTHRKRAAHEQAHRKVNIPTDKSYTDTTVAVCVHDEWETDGLHRAETTGMSRRSVMSGQAWNMYVCEAENS